MIEFRHADFLTIAQELPAAAIVALDRVICVELSSRKQTAVWAADLFVRRSGNFPIAAMS